VSTGSQRVALIVRATLEYPGRMGVAKKGLPIKKGSPHRRSAKGGLNVVSQYRVIKLAPLSSQLVSCINTRAP
jgi:hypothetical protein